MNSNSATAVSGTKQRIEFDDQSVRQFLIASLAWGIVGMLVGVIIALQLGVWQANLNTSWLTFGRLRPLHTNAVIFAFVGNMMFAGIYYSTQRLVKARMASKLLSQIHFWGWQLIILAAAITLPLGLTRGKEYAELIWPINIAVAVIWLVFATNFFWTLKRRNEPTLYVGIWFYIATIITVTMLYVVNHLSLPTSFTHSYPLFGGVQDALVQWWYGHNAVAFFLTTPILGIMYYFVPKAAERPVYSYQLSIIHFWSLVFIYIWAGPHHLLNTALPSWLQSLGMLFSLMLWAPSWGGMLNGLLTLRGAWHKLRTDPVLKFFAAGITFYGMATFEGPLLSIKSVNALSHYTDWTIGHVHSGALGWNGFMAAGMFYWLAPRLWSRPKLHSVGAANMHFWLGLVGILLYVAAMWVSGITQGLMLSATRESGTVLAYPNFIDAVTSTKMLMHIRALGGTMYLTGFIVCAWNIWKTARAGEAHNGAIEVYVEQPEESIGLVRGLVSAPVVYAVCIILFAVGWAAGHGAVSAGSFVAMILTILIAFSHRLNFNTPWSSWHDQLLKNSLPFTILTALAVFVGGIVQIIPTILVNKAEQIEGVRQIPYTPLELAGRDIYVREGCYNCHSQMIRTLVGDVLRYGDYSKLGESVYDYPYQWGSKRTGPDLAREGGKYPSVWHYHHMMDPRQITPGSTMPNYPWLYTSKTDVEALPRKIAVQRKLGVPFPEYSAEELKKTIAEQEAAVVADLKQANAEIAPDREIVAVISYLQKIGKSEAVPATSPAAKKLAHQ
jgi:cytochrome c oxidase cbb3-type subunit I/II